jgi:hypothetical protein
LWANAAIDRGHHPPGDDIAGRRPLLCSRAKDSIDIPLLDDEALQASYAQAPRNVIIDKNVIMDKWMMVDCPIPKRTIWFHANTN